MFSPLESKTGELYSPPRVIRWGTAFCVTVTHQISPLAARSSPRREEGVAETPDMRSSFAQKDSVFFCDWAARRAASRRSQGATRTALFIVMTSVRPGHTTERG